MSTHYVGDACDPPHTHFVGDGCQLGDDTWPTHEADVDILPPAEPLRVPDLEDTGAPMPAEARERQEQFDRDVAAAHERLDEEPSDEKILLATLYLPLSLRTAALVMRVFGREYPEASMENPDGNTGIINIVAPKETGQ